jgi:hypothetical protein
MRNASSPIVLGADQLWHAGLADDYLGTIAAARQALLDLETGLAAGDTVTPREEDIHELADVGASGFDLQNEISTGS